MIVVLSLLVWCYLVCAHGKFWSTQPRLEAALPRECPPVDIIVPARDEAESVGTAVGSLLVQDYAGVFRLLLIDDRSSDGTALVAQNAATAAGGADRLRVIAGADKPAGWSGKLWAIKQGIDASSAPLLLLTDADIVHDPRHLSALVARLQDRRLDLLSEMVRLNCESMAERLLVPAFVYFFQMLYPFSQVNNERSRTAAAAGGTVLIRREALSRIGGIEAIKGALIDDVALATAVKRSGRGTIYLGHSLLAASVRPYPHFGDIWRMIARTAFTQLRHSAALLLLAVCGLTLVWLVPPLALLLCHGWLKVCGAAACLLAAGSYLPTLRSFGRSAVWVLALPVIALFYMAATVGSAVDYWRGAGARWKDRAYRA
jgi:hopene-associated glycosyltransferase HpnB